MTVTRGRESGLPAPLTSFVGRGRETAEVRRLLGTARLVTLTGTGGVGKTRLARETAAASVKAFPGGVWLIGLASVHDPAAVPGVAWAALGLSDQGGRPVREQLAAHLSGRRVLLVLDNCEHLLDACAELAQELLETAPGLRILATSREPLALTGEHVFPVPALDGTEAAELLRDRTAAVRPDFQVTDENRETVSRLCADLDGLPLAIELAASRLRILSVEQVVERLEDRFTLLTAGSRTARPHQRTLRAAIDWSWDLCTPAEQVLWARLSVFAGSFTLDAVEDVCTGGAVEAGDVVDLLDRLASQSLVECAHRGAVPRYRLLETIRQYGCEHLADAREDQRLRRRHRDFYLALVTRLQEDWLGPRQAEILARLRDEHSNLLTALEYRSARPAPHDASACNDPQATLALAGALIHHWVAGGFLTEGRRQLERALAEAPGPTPVRAHALMAAAFVAQNQYDLTAADGWLAEAGALAEQLGEPVLLAHVRGHRGVSALFQGRMEEALSHVERAVAEHTALGDPFGKVSWLNTLAIFRYVAADPRAPETGLKALAAGAVHGERWARAHLLMTMGRRAWTLGELPEAEGLVRSALKTLRGFGDTTGVAKMVEQLAWITASVGDHGRAGRLLGVARSLRHATGVTIAAGEPRDMEYHDRCSAEVRQALGRAGYEQALRDGAALDDPAAAIDYALEPEGETRTVTGPAGAAPPVSPLTRREEQVAALVAQGMTNRRIAAELVLSPRTIDSHVDRILTKLGFSSRAQVAAWWAAH
ncbi:ATP-binding protein [Streptomyces europaeiscabiei]|uniref:ATP-binding protein n=1 Tax=Streptomyces europaeiscabiei TaxID=146819 RepID=UPI0029B1047F|nr:LuxR C-terminal-related transcriptional regulator [Streptomyces europaeiscabiei]MDX3581874.1 LuxR C-terminal-related transcriptional regulator [Streptomyces europaeiscabiei]MDX3632577.1 LuxR C-terminal-related transcriptional regulator [Streptomyces europaeiscabiei]MDX3646859.1 LuxR C-terminal-related transcriptional regulator [Streptomyces europaeiscabiei]WUD36456.1 LuxR C-terminal-related transcriptional regulator [Streptomyces europaeiscabiei]